MQYDRLAETVEKRFPQYVPMVQDARIFSVEEPTDTFEKTGNAMSSWDEDEQVPENFRLPFETIAINSQFNCVALKTINADKREYEAIGVAASRNEGTFAKCKITAFPGGFVADAARLGKICVIEEMEVFRVDGNKVEEIAFSMSELALSKHLRKDQGVICEPMYPSELSRGPATLTVDGKRMTLDEVKQMGRQSLRKAAKELSAMKGELEYQIDVCHATRMFQEFNLAVLQTLLICEPSTFIVEQSQVGLRPRVPQAGKVIRSPYRSHFIVLTPGEIKKRYLYDESDPNGIPKAPHERRGHFRKLTSEKFKAKRNHILWIKPCWVGKTEGIRGKNKYVVRIDL